jgi:hypothetical protein
MEEIKKDYERRLSRLQARSQPNALRARFEALDVDEMYGQSKGLFGGPQVIIQSTFKSLQQSP